MAGDEFGGRGRPAILYLAHRLPYPPDKGDRIRSYHLVRWLSERADVHLACLADEPVSRDSLAALRGLCAKVAVVRLDASRWFRALGSLALGRAATEGGFRSPALEAIIRGWAGETRFRAALASSSGMAPYLRLPETKGIPAVVDLVDVDSQKWLDYAEGGSGPKAALHALEGRRLRRMERNILGWSRATTLVSEAEASLFRARNGDVGSVHAITNGVDLDAFRPSDPGRPGANCVFVGALDYRPNVEGIAWFCREAWPEILRRRPGARIALVGRKPSASIARLAGLPGVDLVGQVPDVRPHLASASVAVVPLRIARGVQNKVLEALAMSKAVVASPGAIEGTRAMPGVHLLSADSADQWADAVVSLLEDPRLARRLGAAGRSYVEEHHDWGRCLAPFARLLGLDAPDPIPSLPFVPAETADVTTDAVPRSRLDGPKW